MPGPTSTPSISDREDVDFSAIPMPPMTTEAVVRGGLTALTHNQAGMTFDANPVNWDIVDDKLYFNSAPWWQFAWKKLLGAKR